MNTFKLELDQYYAEVLIAAAEAHRKNAETERAEGWQQTCAACGDLILALADGIQAAKEQVA